MSDDVDEACTRIGDFLAVQTAGGSRVELDNVLRLQESVGVDDDTRAVFAERLSAVQPNAPAGAVPLGCWSGCRPRSCRRRTREPALSGRRG